MTTAEASGEVERFHKIPWKFQQTFRTPLKALPTFVKTILSVFPFREGRVTIEQAVFEPKNLSGLLARHSIPAQHFQSVTVTAADHKEIAEVLEAAFADWVDFIFVPVPEPFAIYADHDEYTTFFAHNLSNVNQVAAALKSNGFNAIPDYIRNF
jgi:hypothetical protein